MVPIPDRSRARIVIQLLRRLGLGFITAFAALTLTFFLLRLIGTDPVESLLAQGLTSVDQVESMRQQLGLDQPILIQYFHYLSGIIHGDFGVSLYTQRPVLQTILEQFRWTIELAVSGLAAGIILGFVMGVSAAWWEQTLVGALTQMLASLLTALPVAFTGILMLWLTRNYIIPDARTILPALVLGLSISGAIARLIF